ncbi:MAG: stage 0 sporulation family protein [Selenomonas sp.]|uniref:PSP1 domain-containing protein n=1 Tax=Selenomonas sp. TaxID=2053611 RepID=UPI0025EB59A3|nr:stage 0 sporulation family protein [Selenomonas sp.]MCI6085835.1 stage 0 sporulation family protein [Selenomonas sp.]
MQTMIGVRFKKAGKVYDFGQGRLEIEKGDHVIVETARGMECGEVVVGPREVDDKDVVFPVRIVQRIASDDDLQRVADNKEREKEAFDVGVQKIAAHHLPMKLVDVEYTFDRNKIVFYFTADGRIDFRELVKDLASVFRTRIELRQIGVRDEAKLMGGMGCCGRPLCCATFLGEFVPVSIRMAKEQNLSLNPTKISGICGRLMCCLKYENDGYCNGVCCGQKRAVAHEPEQGSIVATMGGDGKVISVNQQRHTATILLNNGRTVVSSWDDIVERDPEELAAENAEGTEEAVLEQAQGGAEDVAASMQSRRPRRPQQNRRPPRRPRDKGERREWRENRSASGERPQDGKPRRPRRPRNNNRPRDRRPRDGQNDGNRGNHGDKNE